MRDGAATADMPLSRYLRQRLRQRPVLPRIDRGAGESQPDAAERRDDPGRLSEFIRIRLTPRARDEIRAAAAAAGMSIAGYARRRLLGHRVIAATDAAQIRELRRLGGLMNKVHVESGGAYSERTAAAIDEIRAAIERLASRRHNVAPGDD